CGICGCDLIRRRAGELRDAARVTVEPRRLEVGGIAEPAEGFVERRVVAERAPRRRLAVDDGRPEIVRARNAEKLLRRLREDRRDRRIERAPRPALNHLGGY